MADRGDVLRLKRRLGFGAKGEADSVVVVQASGLNTVLPTLLVVPLDAAVGAYARVPAVLRASREEAGSDVDQVAVPWRLRAISADSLAPGPVSRLRPNTMRALEDLLKIVLDLS
jgi:mRNA-degrading endonuclease toxin of MazEF toxin-antitoxin module